MTYTPGPWFELEGSVQCTDSYIAHCWKADGGPETRSYNEARANARLIAAAPELLAALQDLEIAAQAHLAASDRSERQYLIEECAKARAAIAKAEAV